MAKVLKSLEDLKKNNSLYCQKCTILVKWQQVHACQRNCQYYKSKLGKSLGDSIKEECFKCIFQNVTRVCLLCFFSADSWCKRSSRRTREHPDWSFCRRTPQSAPHTAVSVVLVILLKCKSETVAPRPAAFQWLLIAFRIKPKFPTVAPASFPAFPLQFPWPQLLQACFFAIS